MARQRHEDRLPQHELFFRFRESPGWGIVNSIPATISPSCSCHRLRYADVLIKPEEQDCDNWTKVSIDMFVG